MWRRTMTRAAGLVVFACELVACSSTRDIRLEIVDDDDDFATVVALTQRISIEAVATNDRCQLNAQCVIVIDDGGRDAGRLLASVEDVEEELRDLEILLELDAGESQTLAINGRPNPDCFPDEDKNEPVWCGNVNLGEARDGTLVVELEPETGNVCPESEDQCP